EVPGAEEPGLVERTLVVLRMDIAQELLRPARQDLAFVTVGYGLVATRHRQLGLGGGHDLSVGLRAERCLCRTTDTHGGAGHLRASVCAEEQADREGFGGLLHEVGRDGRSAAEEYPQGTQGVRPVASDREQLLKEGRRTSADRAAVLLDAANAVLGRPYIH